MSLPPLLEYVKKCPGMYAGKMEFDVVVGFLQGYDLAGHGGLLTGFREWLVAKLGYGNNLHWSVLALRLIFPDAESPCEQLHASGNQKRAVDLLFGLLEEFWQVRQTDGGLRRIYLDYQEWLQRQSWYNASQPDYIDIKVKRPSGTSGRTRKPKKQLA